MAGITGATTTQNVDYSQTAYDRLAYFAYRPELYWDRAVEVKPTRQSMPGSTVIFTIQNDLPVASTPLNESTDVTPVAMSDSQVSVALAEYGSTTVSTARLRGTAFVEIDPIQANVVGYNAGVSIDEVAKNIAAGGTNIDYSGSATSIGTITTGSVFTAANVRFEKARLRRSNVPPFGGLYIAYIHPDVLYDLMAGTGTASWTDPHTYSQPEEIWQGEAGTFQGCRFIETPRTPFYSQQGSSPTGASAYGTVFLGRQALAKAHSIVDGNGNDPHIVPGPVTDYLRRFLPLGWYHLVGYSIFRQAALRQVISGSSIDDLTGQNGPTDFVTLTATATNGSTTLTFANSNAVQVGQYVTGAGITGKVTVTGNTGTVVTVAAGTGGTIGTLTASTYVFSYSLNT